MDRGEQRQLLDELARELEAGEERPLTPLVRKAARLAASLGEGEYRTLFQLHLDGIGPRDQARATPLAGIDPVRTRRAMQALLDDRASGDQVSAHPLPQIEEILAMFRSVENRTISPSEVDLQRVLHRIRNRLGLFITQADATLAAEFSRDPTAGMTVTERLEQMLSESCFAFIVMTGEDLHPDGALHARENVCTSWDSARDALDGSAPLFFLRIAAPSSQISRAWYRYVFQPGG